MDTIQSYTTRHDTEPFGLSSHLEPRLTDLHPERFRVGAGGDDRAVVVAQDDERGGSEIWTKDPLHAGVAAVDINVREVHWLT